MREILFRGQTRRYGEKLLNVAGDKMPSNWVYGGICKGDGDKSIIYGSNSFPDLRPFDKHVVYTDTVGQYTGLTDKNSTKIFEGDVIQYIIFDGFNCQSVVKIGRYNQDGSCGEYEATECYGIYAEVDNFTYPDWFKNEPDSFLLYLTQQNLLEVASECEIIGNIHDNPELLEANNE